MSEKITVTYIINDDGWVYTDSFGLVQLEGRTDKNVGVKIIDGVRTLCIPEQVDDMDVYIIAFNGFQEGFEALYVPDGVGIIMPHAFAGSSELKTVRVPEDMYDISEGAFRGTAVPEERQRELYAMGRMKQEIAEEKARETETAERAKLEELIKEDPSLWDIYKKGQELAGPEVPEEPGNDIPF